MKFCEKIGVILLLSLLFFVAYGCTTTRAETTEYITIQKAQLTLLESELTARVTAGAELATEIADAVTECERRVDEALQRNGRIKNIISEIKRTAK